VHVGGREMAVPSRNDLATELVGRDGGHTAEEVAGELLDVQDPTYFCARAREVLFKPFRRRGKPLAPQQNVHDPWQRLGPIT